LEQLKAIHDVYNLNVNVYFSFLSQYYTLSSTSPYTQMCIPCKFNCQTCPAGFIAYTATDYNNQKFCLKSCPVPYAESNGVCVKSSDVILQLKWLSKSLITTKQSLLQPTWLRAYIFGVDKNTATYRWEAVDSTIDAAIFTTGGYSRTKSFLNLLDYNWLPASTTSIQVRCTVTSGSFTRVQTVTITFAARPSVNLLNSPESGGEAQFEIQNMDGLDASGNFYFMINTKKTSGTYNYNYNYVRKLGRGEKRYNVQMASIYQQLTLTAALYSDASSLYIEIEFTLRVGQS